jgi:hypothetical protein
VIVGEDEGAEVGVPVHVFWRSCFDAVNVIDGVLVGDVDGENVDVPVCDGEHVNEYVLVNTAVNEYDAVGGKVRVNVEVECVVRDSVPEHVRLGVLTHVEERDNVGDNVGVIVDVLWGMSK